ncbi:MAG: AI-2E family transporter [Verrucomicrobia bacterium]|nr:AI-2E family transporter [Verrucomicrobiota bacterium]MBV8485385.1 AI-2E family transporter [Verrucomicrobiota bacterium]
MVEKSDARGSDLDKLAALALPVLILCVLIWAKEFLLPVVLAILVSLLLTPVVFRLERWRFPPVLAVLSVVAVAFAIIAGLCATVSIEALDLANSLPKYSDNIRAKWAAIQKGPPGPLNLAFQNIGSLVDELSKGAAPAKLGQATEPMKVQIVSGTDAVVAFIRNSMTPVLTPVVNFAVVVVLVIFVLLERKRLRDRFLRLIGHSRFATTTLAIDEAGTRLSGFLLGQLQVNSVYAFILWVGLSLIGIPNAILWAILTLLLRFLPYVGLWISAFFPLILSVAISSDWKAPLLTLALYALLEVVTNNFVEPIVLGGSTGISPLAVIISALFWTWLWGPIGLLVATPLAACLVVLGRYFSGFHFCSVLLAADPPTSSETKLLRLLTENRTLEAKRLIHELDGQLSVKLAEELLVPAIRAIENDFLPSTAASTKLQIYRQLRDLIEELPVPPSNAVSSEPKQTETKASDIVILPHLGEGDEMVGAILARLLRAEGIKTELVSSRALRPERLERVKLLQPKQIVLSATQSGSIKTIERMMRATNHVSPDSVISVCLWSLPREGAARSIRKIRESSRAVYTGMEEAVRNITVASNTAAGTESNSSHELN